MKNDFYFENENAENTPPDLFENETENKDVEINFSEENNEVVENQTDQVNNFNNVINSRKTTYIAENRQNPPSFQPNYYGYQHSYQQYYGNINQNSEALQLYYEKMAVKRTANHIGVGLILFYLFQIVFYYFLSFFMTSQKSIDFINNPAINLELNIFYSFLGFGLTALFIIKTEGRKASQLISYGLPKKGSLLPAIMVGLGFCYAANVVVTMLQTKLQSILPFAQPEIELPDGILGFILSVLSIAVAPALIEEFLFRGVIMGSLLKFGKAFAIFTSAFLFGLVHGNLVQIPFAFMVGLVIGAMVVETNSFWTGVIIHFLNNFISVCMDYLLRVSDENILNVAYLFLLASLIIIGFFGFYILSNKNKDLFAFKKTAHISSTLRRFGWFSAVISIIIYFVIIFIEIFLMQISGV